MFYSKVLWNKKQDIWKQGAILFREPYLYGGFVDDYGNNIYGITFKIETIGA